MQLDDGLWADRLRRPEERPPVRIGCCGEHELIRVHNHGMMCRPWSGIMPCSCLLTARVGARSQALAGTARSAVMNARRKPRVASPADLDGSQLTG